MTKQIFKSVKEAAKWLNEKDVYRQNIQNLEEILSNYDLEVEGMSSIRYKSDDEELWFAFFKIENGKVVDFENIELDCCVFVQDYDEIVEQMKDVYFEDIMKDFESYLDGRPLKKGENIIRVFENWVISKSYGYNEDELVRLYEYNILIKEADDIAEKYANKKVNAAVSADV